ncbi:MAG: hypothetical protein NTY45_10715 [Elusimicrobia bacterium]|nr:hypothetical protein [Elusimicrobiota bacterium]
MKRILIAIAMLGMTGAAFAGDGNFASCFYGSGNRSMGADLTAASYDRTQGIAVSAGKVAVGGAPGRVEITGVATGRSGGDIDGTINLWLSIFRFKRPDGTVNHVAGWNIMLALKPGQTAAETANAFASYINAGTRPYRAAVAADGLSAMLVITYSEK